MTSRRQYLLLAALPATAAMTLAACSSSSGGFPAGHSAASSGAGSTSSAASSAPASSASSSASQASAGNSAQQLAATLAAGAASVRSAHLTLDISVDGQRITGGGDEKANNGKVSALNISESLPGGQQVVIIYVDGKTYAKLPALTAQTGKPYSLVTTSSSNATIRALASSIQSSLQSASVDQARLFAQAAASVKNDGKTQVDGVDTTHYSVVVDPTKLPSTLPGKSALTSAGITSIPVELYVDDQGRPVQVVENLTVAGKKTSTRATISRYNQPVTITAPPASQVSTR